MGRLPDPIVEKIDVTWSEDGPLREKDFYSILGQSVRAAEQKGKGADRDEN